VQTDQSRLVFRCVDSLVVPPSAPFTVLRLLYDPARNAFIDRLDMYPDLRAGTLTRVSDSSPRWLGLCEAARLVSRYHYSAEGLSDLLKGTDFSGQRVLRLRSEKAGALLADVLRSRGAQVEDVRLYTNDVVAYEALPEFDAVFFASASAVEGFVEAFSAARLNGKTVVAIGKPTAEALSAVRRPPDVIAAQATVEGAIEAMARDRLFA